MYFVSYNCLNLSTFSFTANIVHTLDLLLSVCQVTNLLWFLFNRQLKDSIWL